MGRPRPPGCGRRQGGAVDIRILGPLEVLDDDGQRIEVAGRRQRAVLAMLALRPGAVVSSDALVEAVWGPAAAGLDASSLWTVVSRLRRAVGDGRVVTSSPGY